MLFSDYQLPVNIGNPNEISILDFATEILKQTKSNQKIIFKDLPKNDPLQRQPDITLAKKILDWEPKVKRHDGMMKTFEYFKSLPKEKLFKKEHKDFSNYIKE